MSISTTNCKLTKNVRF